VGDVDVGGSVMEIAAGGNHTCALLTNGHVRCWGDNAVGQLGYGNTSDVGLGPISITDAGDVNVGDTVSHLALGKSHTCALMSTGSVRCWGSGVFGKLGYGNTSNVGDTTFPAMAGDVAVGGAATQVAAGDLHTCAILTAGGVRCWGEGQRVGLGGMNIGDDEDPSTATVLPVGSDIKEVSLGDDHSCVVLDSGVVRCWGWALNGRLGYPNQGGAWIAAGTDDVNVGASVAKLGVGGEHTCVLLTTGGVRCWGKNTVGQLGYGNTDNIGDNESPQIAGDVQVADPPM
jgi:alpha-tubulin suppressor-like RCC1 family protein